MNQDAGKINIVFAADTEDVERGAERIETVLNQTGESAEVAGKRIDNAFKQETMSVRELSEVIETQSKVVSDLRNAYERAKQAASDAFGGDEAKYRELVDAQEKLKKEYDEETEALRKLNAQRDAMNTSGDAEESLRMRLRAATQELASLTLKYREMSDEEKSSARGKELKKKLEELTKKAGNLRDAMDDANRAIRSTASDTQNFDALAGGLNIVTSTAGAAQGALSMLGVNEEALMNIQTKLQASLAISNALSVIQNNLQKESAVMLGIRKVQEYAAAKAIAVRTAAEGKGIIATKAATVAQKAFNLVARANPYVLLATACITGVGALLAFTRGTKEATDVTEKQRKEAEKLAEAQRQLKQAIGTAVGNTIGQYMTLQKQWENLSNAQEKNKWIDENKGKFNQMGLSIKNINDAEKAFVSNSQAVIAALKSRAEAEAWGDIYKERIRKKFENDSNGSVSNGRYRYVYNQGDVMTVREIEKALGKELGQLNNSTYLRPVGIHVGTRYGQSEEVRLTSMAAADLNNAAIKKQNALLQAEADGIDEAEKKMVESQKAAVEAQKAIADLIPKDIRGGKTREQIEREARQAADAYNKAIENARKAMEEAEVKATEDDENRAIKQLALSHKRKLEEIDREEQELLAKKKASEGEDAVLSEAELRIFEDRRKAENQIYENALADRAAKAAEQEKADMEQYLMEYGDYQEAITAIHERFVSLRAKAETDGRRNSLVQQELSEIEALNRKFEELKLDKLKNCVDYIRAMGNLAAYSSMELDNMRKHLERMVAAGGSAMSAQELEAYREALERIEKQQEQLKHPFGNSWLSEIKQIKKLEKDIEEEKKRQKKLEEELIKKKEELVALQKQLKELQEQGNKADQQSIDTTIQKIGETQGQIAQLNSSLGDSASKIGAMGGQMQAIGAGAGATLGIVDAIIKGVAQSIRATIAMFNDIKDLAKSFGADVDSGTWDDISAVMDIIGEANEHAEQGWESLKSGNIMGAVQHTVGFITSIISGINALIDRKHERRIKEIQKDIDKLEKAYDDLERAVNHTYSTIKQGNIELEISSKQQQINLIQKQIQEERDKKDTDDDRIAEWEDKIHDLQQEIIDLREEAVDAIFGENINNAIDNFASAYADAWASGEDKAKSAKETVKGMMKQMVTESIKSAIQASGAMENIRQRLQDFYADNVLTPWEQERVLNMAEQLQRQLDAQFGWADSLFNDKEKSQNSTSRGFETMSQDQSSELTGRFTGIQMETAMIDAKLDKMIENNTAIRANAATIAEEASQMVELQGVAISHLAQIEKNTNELPEMNERLSKIEKNTRSL